MYDKGEEDFNVKCDGAIFRPTDERDSPGSGAFFVDAFAATMLTLIAGLFCLFIIN